MNASAITVEIVAENLRTLLAEAHLARATKRMLQGEITKLQALADLLDREAR
jgi:hypothetical protein